MKTERMTVGQAVVSFLASQYSERTVSVSRLIWKSSRTRPLNPPRLACDAFGGGTTSHAITKSASASVQYATGTL